MQGISTPPGPCYTCLLLWCFYDVSFNSPGCHGNIILQKLDFHGIQKVIFGVIRLSLESDASGPFRTKRQTPYWQFICCTRPVARSGFGGCFSGESGPSRVLSLRQWGFLCIFWEKVYFFAYFFGESGLFCVSPHVGGKLPGKIWKIWLKSMH